MHKMIDKVFDIRSSPHNTILRQVDRWYDDEEVSGKLQTLLTTLSIELNEFTTN